MKTALITGSSRGIGRAIARRLAADGMRCVVTGRDEAALAEVAQGIGSNTPWLAVDLREPGAAERLVAFAASQLGGLDVVVNNAGATKRGDFLDLTDEDWLDGFALKFFGAVRVTRAAWPHLKKTAGSVVTIAGVGGRTPGPQFSVGGSVNAALMAFTKSLADTGVRDGVQVNAINPGLVRTDRFVRRLASTTEEQLIASEKIVRVGEPEEIAELVSFVVGPRGRFLQGALIDMDGGATKSV